ncbi:cytochrome P450 [Streptomyces beijiangensis]|uniref:Cytochrome P450 n=1 Tax=Streptomyces beijiangensis TaxID=163361 RepID=A0A939F3V3_9ACTN|nr:cytochrome P450 [Streptomyces beijiangensis]MBO0512061.1 cytochrome P450 [Streptomyces beijiangensis]
METFAPLSPAMLEDPYSVYRKLQSDDPVHWHEQLQAWIVTRHADCMRVLEDPATFVNDYRVVGDHVPEDILGLQTLDAPEHGQVRDVLLRAIRQVDLPGWVAQCRANAGELLEKLGIANFDFVTEFNDPLTTASMCLFFGVKDLGDKPTYWAAVRALVLGMDSGLEPSRAQPRTDARIHVSQMLEPWIRQPSSPGALRLLELPADEALRRYVFNSVRMVFFAGIMSPGSTLSCVMRALVERGLLDQDQPLTIDNKVYNELVRHSGAVQVDARACAHDTTIGSQRIRAGDQVLIVPAAANRDPAVFSTPEDLVLDRSPNPHIGFGRGAHSCVGAQLAMALHVAILQELTARYRIRLVGEPVPRPTGTLRGFDQILLAAHPRKP